jgi:hypothetical protein
MRNWGVKIDRSFLPATRGEITWTDETDKTRRARQTLGNPAQQPGQEVGHDKSPGQSYGNRDSHQASVAHVP